jgi:hypothetical protein
MSSDASLDEVRAELIRLLDNDDWQIVKTTAREPGLPILRAMGLMPTDGAMIEYITRLLRTNFPFHAEPLGEPPGSAGTGYVMNNSDGRGLYIKVKIERRRTDEVIVMSFHVSKHFKG